MTTPFNAIDDGRRPLTENFADLIATKQRSADASFRRSVENLEAPQTVFLDSCETIASRVEEHGFKFAKSGSRCTRREGDLTFTLHFLSDQYNVAGEYVALTAAAEVASKRFRKWSQEQTLFNPNGTIVSGQLGYLCDDHLDLRWNLASADVRSNVIDGIVDAIDQIAFPFFDRFSNFQQLRCDLQTGAVPMMDTTDAIYFLMCFGTRDEAVSAGKHFLLGRPDVKDDYRNELCQLESREPLQVRGLGWARELAIVTHFFGLGDLTVR